ncbi:MAG: hypothetical protein KKD25_18490 [Gammaproteobacteria bacterium]|jgi:hypothetical protein|nr:hypothetical protein [Gammaproteobacteria bacterium]MBU0772358.1 hypothetical protein [Gammaproteobacteria bacterium]MBU0854781.1 hypothetical protein [Gammaproteobacteria bacterium]MBU1845387.1 hypothetical protein [Gammaproteobacteria bacterium]
MQRAPLKGGVRRLLHAVVVIAGWLLFAWAWSLVLRDLPDYGLLAWLIGATLVVCPAITLYWVLHNRAIFRAKGPRTHALEAHADYAQDWNGHEVVADWDVLRGARITVVGIVNQRKIYRSLAARPAQPELTRLFGKG